MNYLKTLVLECCHCGNRTPHAFAHGHKHHFLWDTGPEDEEIHQDHFWATYICGTCGGLSLFGEFEEFFRGDWNSVRLYPKGSNLRPRPETVSPQAPIPPKILKVYAEVWPLRRRAPSAFVAQIRRLLEFICKDQKAKGATLFTQLKDLISKGIFPGYFSDMTELLRTVGNLGAHAADEELSIWDAELIDEFFRSTVDYVYIAPARIQRMQQRLAKNDDA